MYNYQLSFPLGASVRFTQDYEDEKGRRKIDESEEVEGKTRRKKRINCGNLKILESGGTHFIFLLVKAWMS